MHALNSPETMRRMLMFKICPDCDNDKLKTKLIGKRMYDPSTTKMIVEGDVPMMEYHCQVCGWTILVEDPPLVA